ncbi:unnamed protein product [Brachionus calyciflorus]|uniref:Uncharacterized protein n=1 Tax=Brachionus calyciflorus TaxID=104777 RepID=A0A813S5S0_9BILA|nr:unnamed protein product [Brachionus calyciflorus]
MSGTLNYDINCNIKKDKNKKTTTKKNSKIQKNHSDKNNKSKEAARSRRNRENDEFKYLSSLLPLQSEITKQLDKASVIRLTISFLKLRKFYDECNLLNKVSTNNFREAFEISSFIPPCLDGFLFLLGQDGKFLYVTESVSSILGLSQVVMIGTHIFEYIHHDDREEFLKVLGLQTNLKTGTDKNLNFLDSSISDFSNDSFEDKMFGTCSGDSGKKVTFTIRFKSTLIKKNNFIKSSGWRLIQVIGRLDSSKLNPNLSSGFFGMGLSVETQYMCEISLSNVTFIIKLNNNFAIESIENLPSCLKINPLELVGSSIFHLISPFDLNYFVEKLDEVKKKEHGIFSFRLASVGFSNILCNCSAVLITKPSLCQINNLEYSIIESFQIVLINNLTEMSDFHYEKDSTFIEQIYNPIEHDSNYSFDSITNDVESYANKIPKTLDSVKIKAKKCFNNELVNHEAFTYEKTVPEFTCLNHDFINYEANKSSSKNYDSFEYPYQNYEHLNSNSFEYTNSLNNVEINEMQRSYTTIGSSHNSQIVWELEKQDELGFLCFSNFQKYSNQGLD